MDSTFLAFVRAAYNEVGCSPYSVDDVLCVFAMYLRAYRENMKNEHPIISMEQIKRIIRVMPYLDNEATNASREQISVSDYEKIIPRHFETKYRNCDYRLNHFFSGKIREFRFYEACVCGKNLIANQRSGSSRETKPSKHYNIVNDLDATRTPTRLKKRYVEDPETGERYVVIDE